MLTSRPISFPPLPALKHLRATKSSRSPVERSECVPQVLRQPNHDRRYRPRQAFVLLVLRELYGRFAYHAINGSHGLEAKSRLIPRSDLPEFEIRSLEAVRAKLQRDVDLLTPDKPDADLVEEIARDMLGFARPQDRIVVRP